MTSTSKPAVQTDSKPRRFKSRCGGCTRHTSTLRPISSSFPAHFQNPGADPKGFAGFGGRGDFSVS